MTKRVFSGMQPTGSPHLGNLIGAFDNWVKMQEDYEAFYCVVDLHAMTVPYDPAELRAERLNLAKTILAVGVDPKKSLLYYQSEVPQHVELTWILGTMAGVGHLERMIQYKEKAGQYGENFGLLAYPVLQAADILIHRVHAVPVGDDQTQHLELTRDLAERFNNRFGEEFPIPERITPEIGARVMSLTDPNAKMSKTDSAKSTIDLADSDDEIVKKFKAAVTDTGSEVEYDWEKKPGISNLLEIFSYATGRSIESLATEYRTGGYGNFKLAVAEAVTEKLGPIREAHAAMSDSEVEAVMSSSAERARVMAEETMVSVRERVGLG